MTKKELHFYLAKRKQKENIVIWFGAGQKGNQYEK